MNPLDTLRSDQVGSLLRPPALLQAYERRARGEITDDGLRAAQDEAIRAAVARQESTGLPVVTDGEFRRIGFQDSLGEAVEGFVASRSSFPEQVARNAECYTGLPAIDSGGAALSRPSRLGL